MSGIDLARLGAVKLSSRPLLQRILARWGLTPNFELLPGVEIAFEGQTEPPPAPVIVAINHTDRYGYFPFAYEWWRRFDRYFTAWAKGKYFENPILAAMINAMGGIPTVSRGYIITKDFVSVMGRKPDENEYRIIRDHVDARLGETGGLQGLPEKFTGRPRNVLGLDFDPAREEYGVFVNRLFRKMMVLFMEIHRQGFDRGRDLMIFPEGTRSATLGRGRPGIGQVALHFRIPVIPVGANGTDRAYPGVCPLAKRAKMVFRLGSPITYGDLAEFHIDEPFVPFTAEAEEKYGEKFQGATDLIMSKIENLLDPEYRPAGTGGPGGVKRFI